MKGWIKMLCFGELLRKRDVLESIRGNYEQSHPINMNWINKTTIEILAIDLRITRIQI